MTAVTLERLRDAVAVHAASVPRVSKAQPELPAIEGVLPGRWRETQHGPVFVRDEWYPLDHLHGALPLRCGLEAAPEALHHLLGGPAPQAERLAFFDIETTGLSGGTGMYIVLAGVGSYDRAAPGEPLAFRMRQYFLGDLAQERAMLGALAEDLARADGVVTYNGRAFDLPFLKSRLTLARMRSPCEGMAHFDLLHPVRRLYRHRMNGCTLGEAERRLLRIERMDDIGGALIPSLYFAYLRAGITAPLRAVFRHNADDVLSLAGVLARVTAVLSGQAQDPDDMTSAGRWWEAAGYKVHASSLYRKALPWLEGGTDWGWVAARHAALCKRLGEREEAVALWQKLFAWGNRAAGLELAKHLEHRARDLPAAEEVTRALLIRAGETEWMPLTKRLARIQRKRHNGAR